MPDPQIPFRTEKLSHTEIRLLRWRMICIWLVAAVMGALASYLIFSQMAAFGMGAVPMILFAVFFFGILIFIVGVHTVNAFRTEKRVYSGRITDKRTEASRMRNSQLNESYYVSLDGHWFRVELNSFSHAHVGDKVEISTFGSGQVFKIERKLGQAVVSEGAKHVSKQTDIYASFPDFREKLTESETSVLKRALVRAVLFRTLIGFAGAYITYFVLSFIFLIGFVASGTNAVIYIFYAIWLVVAIAFVWLNLKTVRLIRDIFGGEKEVVSETITDLIHSTHRKPGPNSIVQGSYYSAEQYYYIQTEHSWLRTDEETFKNAIAGKQLQIYRGPRSKIILRIQL